MKISCKLLGGIGNCLFIIATTIAHSLKYGCDYCIPTEIDNPHYEGQKVFYSKYLKYCDNEYKGIKCFYNEKSFSYNEIPKPTCEYLTLSGYFQSFLYFNEYRDEIIKILDIPVLEYKPNKIFIHYRVGDYKILGNFHKIITQEYIAAALLKFFVEGQTDVIVFSDEPEIAKEKINSTIWPQFKFEYSEGRTELQDLSFMAACAGGIMSASSFSWFGAWLGSQNRLITYPLNWFGESAGHDIKDLTMPNWIGI